MQFPPVLVVISTFSPLPLLPSLLSPLLYPPSPPSSLSPFSLLSLLPLFPLSPFSPLHILPSPLLPSLPLPPYLPLLSSVKQHDAMTRDASKKIWRVPISGFLNCWSQRITFGLVRLRLWLLHWAKNNLNLCINTAGAAAAEYVPYLLQARFYAFLRGDSDWFCDSVHFDWKTKHLTIWIMRSDFEYCQWLFWLYNV